MTLLLPELVTHMFVPSNAIPLGEEPAAKVPSGPHVGGTLGSHGTLRQSPTPRGARQSLATGGQALQGPVMQSALLEQLDAFEVLEPQTRPSHKYGAQIVGVLP